MSCQRGGSGRDGCSRWKRLRDTYHDEHWEIIELSNHYTEHLKLIEHYIFIVLPLKKKGQAIDTWY